jgi:hypothetical protein
MGNVVDEGVDISHCSTAEWGYGYNAARLVAVLACATFPPAMCLRDFTLSLQSRRGPDNQLLTFISFLPSPSIHSTARPLTPSSLRLSPSLSPSRIRPSKLLRSHQVRILATGVFSHGFSNLKPLLVYFALL